MMQDVRAILLDPEARRIVRAAPRAWTGSRRNA
jgi:hypothetical protein